MMKMMCRSGLALLAATAPFGCSDSRPSAGNDEDTDTGGTGDGDSGDGDGDSGDGDPGDGDGDGDPGDGDGDGDGDPGDGDGDGDECPLGTLDCPCDLGSICLDGLTCVSGTCVEGVCGNGRVETNESCDDGNFVDGDGCDGDCSATEILDVGCGENFTCVVLEGGRVRCFGDNGWGIYGLGANVQTIGDDEPASQASDVPLPEPAVEIAVGAKHVCVREVDGGVRCWGHNAFGQLGIGTTETLGDDELADVGPSINLAAPAVELAALGYATCARFENGDVRCWGDDNDGMVGVGQGAQSIGDDELPLDIPVVPLGLPAVSLPSSSPVARHVCAVVTGGTVRCWGRNSSGRLGYQNTETYFEPGPDVQAVSVDLPPQTEIVEAGVGGNTCVAYAGGGALCWGSAHSGLFGNGLNTQGLWGDTEPPSVLPAIDLGAPIVAFGFSGASHICALLADGGLNCWGASGNWGALGRANPETIGDDESAADAGPLELEPVVDIAVGLGHTCARTNAHELYCFGYNLNGALGYGHVQTIGDDELPMDVGPVPLF